MQSSIYSALRDSTSETMTPTGSEPVKAAEYPGEREIIDRIGHLFISLIALLVLCTCLYVLTYQWLKYRHSLTSFPVPPPGLKKAALGLLPTSVYTCCSVGDARNTECAICLTEFADGDVTKTLPQCGHVFHSRCIDEWLQSRSSCPSCRQLVIVLAGFSSHQTGNVTA